MLFAASAEEDFSISLSMNRMFCVSETTFALVTVLKDVVGDGPRHLSGLQSASLACPHDDDHVVEIIKQFVGGFVTRSQEESNVAGQSRIRWSTTRGAVD